MRYTITGQLLLAHAFLRSGVKYVVSLCARLLFVVRYCKSSLALIVGTSCMTGQCNAHRVVKDKATAQALPFLFFCFLCKARFVNETSRVGTELYSI